MSSEEDISDEGTVVCNGTLLSTNEIEDNEIENCSATVRVLLIHFRVFYFYSL